MNRAFRPSTAEILARRRTAIPAPTTTIFAELGQDDGDQAQDPDTILQRKLSKLSLDDPITTTSGLATADNRHVECASDLETGGQDEAELPLDGEPESDVNLHRKLLNLSLEDPPDDDTVGWSRREAPLMPLVPLPNSRLPYIPPPRRLADNIEPSPSDKTPLLKAIETLKGRFDEFRLSLDQRRLQTSMTPKDRKAPFPLADELSQLLSFSRKLAGVPTRGHCDVQTFKTLLAASMREQLAVLERDQEHWLMSCNSIAEDTRTSYYNVEEGACPHVLLG